MWSVKINVPGLEVQCTSSHFDCRCSGGVTEMWTGGDSKLLWKYGRNEHWHLFVCGWFPLSLKYMHVSNEAELKGSATHMRSTFVNTPIVLVTSGSTSRAIFNPSEFAKSMLAPVTARIMQAGLEIYLCNISQICFQYPMVGPPQGPLSVQEDRQEWV